MRLTVVHLRRRGLRLLTAIAVCSCLQAARADEGDVAPGVRAFVCNERQWSVGLGSGALPPRLSTKIAHQGLDIYAMVDADLSAGSTIKGGMTIIKMAPTEVPLPARR